MKKLLLLTVLFTGFSFTNSIAQNAEIIIGQEGKDDCFNRAWDFGTDMDGAFGVDAYFWMDAYYTENCL